MNIFQHVLEIDNYCIGVLSALIQKQKFTMLPLIVYKTSQATYIVVFTPLVSFISFISELMRVIMKFMVVVNTAGCQNGSQNSSNR